MEVIKIHLYLCRKLSKSLEQQTCRFLSLFLKKLQRQAEDGGPLVELLA